MRVRTWWWLGLAACGSTPIVDGARAVVPCGGGQAFLVVGDVVGDDFVPNTYARARDLSEPELVVVPTATGVAYRQERRELDDGRIGRLIDGDGDGVVDTEVWTTFNGPNGIRSSRKVLDRVSAPEAPDPAWLVDTMQWSFADDGTITGTSRIVRFDEEQVSTFTRYTFSDGVPGWTGATVETSGTQNGTPVQASFTGTRTAEGDDVAVSERVTWQPAHPEPGVPATWIATFTHQDGRLVGQTRSDPVGSTAPEADRITGRWEETWRDDGTIASRTVAITAPLSSTVPDAGRPFELGAGALDAWALQGGGPGLYVQRDTFDTDGRLIARTVGRGDSDMGNRRSALTDGLPPVDDLDVIETVTVERDGAGVPVRRTIDDGVQEIRWSCDADGVDAPVDLEADVLGPGRGSSSAGPGAGPG